jgi:hypothetical protein
VTVSSASSHALNLQGQILIGGVASRVAKSMNDLLLVGAAIRARQHKTPRG